MFARADLDALTARLAAGGGSDTGSGGPGAGSAGPGAGSAGPGADAALARDARRVRGAYFTPPALVEFVAAHAIAARADAGPIRWRRDGTPHLRVLDPAAGDGRFLVAAARLLARRAAARRRGRRAAGDDRAVADVTPADVTPADAAVTPAAVAAILGRCVVGVERDPGFCALARAALGDGADLHCREALVDAPAGVRDADIVIGNPPYVRSIHLRRADPALWRAVRGRYAATSRGEWDLYAAFLEQALAWTRPGGAVGLVVPSRWLTAAFAAGLRAYLADRGAVRGVVEFGAAQIFPGATTYASAVFLTRARNVSVAVARRVGEAWRIGTVPADELSDAPWRLSVGAARTLVARLADRGAALGDVAHIVKGAGTNADGVYVVQDAVRAGGRVRGRSKAGGDVDVEAGACRPCVRGRDVRAWAAVDPRVQCIVPYTGGALWSPDALARDYPRAAAYLSRARARLDAREGGRLRGDTFYRFGRPQNMAFLSSPAAKVIVPDVARDGRAMLDRGGAMVLDSAYALRVSAPDRGYSLALLLAVLNASVVRLWLRETGVPLRGGYVRMKTAYLRSLPLPPLSAHTRRAEALAARADASGSAGAGAVASPDAARGPGGPLDPVGLADLRADIDDCLRRAYGMTRDEWDQAAADD